MKPTRLALAATLLALLGCLGPEAPAPKPALRVAGAAATHEVSQGLVAHFTVAHPEVETTLLPATDAALAALRAGECDLACVARALDVEEARDLTVVPFARDAVARTLAFVASREPSAAARAFLKHLSHPEVSARLAAASLVPLRLTLRLAVPPARNIVSVEVKFGALARYLAHKLCRPVELAHQTSYADLVAGFRDQTVDAALLGSLAYAAVHTESGVEVLARPQYGGRSHYRGVLYVRADSPYRTLEDLKGKRIALSGKYTTAGDLFPEYTLASRGLPPLPRFFSRAFDAGSHEAALRALAQGRVEAAAAKDLVYEEMVREDPSLGARTRPLAASEPVPGDGFGAGPGLGAALKGRLRQVLLTMHETDDGRQALRDMGADRFVSTTDADYRPVYAMLAGVKKALKARP